MILSAVDNIFFGQLFPNTRPSSSREWTTFELQTWKSIKIPISKNPHLVRITIYLRYDVIGNSSVAQIARRISSLSIPGIYILKQRKFYQSFPLCHAFASSGLSALDRSARFSRILNKQATATGSRRADII